jgi:hypothetical protein
VGFVVDKAALRRIFSEYFSFPCQSSFHQLLHNHHHLLSIIWGWYNRPVDSVYYDYVHYYYYYYYYYYY